MIVDRYRPEDRAEIDALFTRVFGAEQAGASARRWEWQYRHNPTSPAPQIWIARDGSGIVGQYATMPVRLRVDGREIDASWGMDVMIAPERQRKGLGEVLFRTWDEHTGASLGMGLSVSSHQLFRKLRWPDVGPVPCLVKPLTTRAFTKPRWPGVANRVAMAAAAPVVAVMRRDRHDDPRVRSIEAFDGRFTDLWARAAPKFRFAVRRDAAYLEWKYVDLPHIRYQIVSVDAGARVLGYAVFRHLDDARGRATALVDLFADPDDRSTIRSLLSAVEGAARAAGSDKIRAFMMNEAIRKAMRSHGYFRVDSTVQLVVKVNAVPVDKTFYADTRTWHVTFGDSDQDR